MTVEELLVKIKEFRGFVFWRMTRILGHLGSPAKNTV